MFRGGPWGLGGAEGGLGFRAFGFGEVGEVLRGFEVFAGFGV